MSNNIIFDLEAAVYGSLAVFIVITIQVTYIYILPQLFILDKL